MYARMLCVGLTAGLALGMVLPATPANAESHTLKFAPLGSGKHPASKRFRQWTKDIEAKSGGRIKIAIVPPDKRAPYPKRHAMVLSGAADISWLLHGFSPGKFPLTGLSGLPDLVGSAEAGSKMLNDPALKRAYLDREHKGMKALLLFTSSPVNLFLATGPVKGIADMKGKRIRAATVTMRSFIAALGATPVRVPAPRMLDAMKKGTLHGTLTDYGGAAIAFRLAPVTKHVTEIYSSVASFCLCMNAGTYQRLPADLRKLIDQSFVGIEAEIGKGFDGLDPIGKRIMLKAGVKPVKLSTAEAAKFRTIGAQVAAARVAALEKRGLPARAAYTMMQKLAAKHGAGSKDFRK